MTALRNVEIARIQADRTRNLAAKTAPTRPTDPWAKNGKTALADVATRALQGSYNVSDIRFMAMALIQMSEQMENTMTEFRERLNRLENDLPPRV